MAEDLFYQNGYQGNGYQIGNGYQNGTGYQNVNGYQNGNGCQSQNGAPIIVTTSTNIFCHYCGYANIRGLAFCSAENCVKWFCNGTRDGLGKSHIVAHACYSKHTTFGLPVLYKLPKKRSNLVDMPVEWVVGECTYQPQCNQCHLSNIFELGVEDPNDSLNSMTTWCRKHATIADKVLKDRWYPLVACHKNADASLPNQPFFIRVASWMMHTVGPLEMMAYNHMSYELWRLTKLDRTTINFLEEYWLFCPDGDRDSFVNWKAYVHFLYDERKTLFGDRLDYSDHWNLFIEELKRQEKGTIESLPVMKNFTAIWLGQNELHVYLIQGICTEHLEIGRPLKISFWSGSEAGSVEVWSRDATVAFVFEVDVVTKFVKIVLLEKLPREFCVQEGLQLKLEYNDINFWRMQQALYKFAHDARCMSELVAGVLLGRRISAEELQEWGSAPLEDAEPEPSGELDGAPGDSDGEDEQEVVSLVEFRTMNASFSRRSLPPLHSEYAGLTFRRFNFTTIFSAQTQYVLNEKQKESVRMALQTPVCIIQGPPGTGKTQTAAAIVANFAQDRGGRILCCAPSNVAIDNLCIKITEIAKSLKVLRLFSHTRDIFTLHEDVQQYTVQAEWFRRHGNRVQPTEEALRIFERAYVKEVDVVCTTCNSAGLFTLERVQFPYVIIDEAAQGTEPDCLIPITRGCEKLVLIGDADQLGTVIKFTNLQGSQLADSLFKRLWTAKKIPWMMLSQQYRMHPAISDMISRLTYNGALENDRQVNDRSPASQFLQRIFPDPLCPMVFIDISKNDELSGLGTSYVNIAEGHFVARLVANILHEGDVFYPGCRPSPDQIGIITFYNGQRPHIKDQLRHHIRVSGCWRDVDVNSVDGFQGREKDILILSCVRSAGAGNQGIGFTGNAQRLNVAFSRARKALIVVGDYELLQQHQNWRKYFEFIPVETFFDVCKKLPLRCSCRVLPCSLCPFGGSASKVNPSHRRRYQ